MRAIYIKTRESERRKDDRERARAVTARRDKYKMCKEEEEEEERGLTLNADGSIDDDRICRIAFAALAHGVAHGVRRTDAALIAVVAEFTDKKTATLDTLSGHHHRHRRPVCSFNNTMMMMIIIITTTFLNDSVLHYYLIEW